MEVKSLADDRVRTGVCTLLSNLCCYELLSTSGFLRFDNNITMRCSCGSTTSMAIVVVLYTQVSTRSSTRISTQVRPRAIFVPSREKGVGSA